MSLTTTMGVELTYVPKAVQLAINRGATFDTSSAPGESSLLDGFCHLMRHMVKIKNIPTWNGVQRDPGCIEIQTRPYKRISSLTSIARRLRIEAEALGLVTDADYTGGGGAHVHTGVIGKTEEDRKAYSKRMILFGAMNPWLGWATLSVVDDINAKPIPLERLIKRDEQDGYTEQDYINLLANARQELQGKLIRLHTTRIWQNYFSRRDFERDIMGLQPYIRRLMKELRKRNNKLVEETTIPVADITFCGNKDHIMRLTDYGKYGTVEFRSFEMGDEAKIKRNLVLANAICNYCERCDITKFDINAVMTAERMRAVKWSEARAGWLGMLAQLGLDPAEYRDETAQLARRWRYSREQKVDPTAVEWVRPGRATRATDDSVARHRDEAMEAAWRGAARARARWERRQNRRGRVAPPTVAPDDCALAELAELAA